MSFNIIKNHKIARDAIGYDIAELKIGRFDPKEQRLDSETITKLLREGVLEEPKEDLEKAEHQFDAMKEAAEIEDKEELDDFAKYLGIALDRRKSLANMKKQFKTKYQNKMLKTEIENK